MSDTKLLPCPFCGGECDPQGWLSGTAESPTNGPECDGCGATASTVDDWNRRAQPERVALSDAKLLAIVDQEYANGRIELTCQHDTLGRVPTNVFKCIARAILSAQADAGIPASNITQPQNDETSASVCACCGSHPPITQPLIAEAARDDAAGRGPSWFDDLGKAIERAADELPDGADLHIEIERGAGVARLYMPPQGDDDSGEVLHDWDGDTFADQINHAIDYAIAASTTRESK